MILLPELRPEQRWVSGEAFPRVDKTECEPPEPVRTSEAFYRKDRSLRSFSIKTAVTTYGACPASSFQQPIA